MLKKTVGMVLLGILFLGIFFYVIDIEKVWQLWGETDGRLLTLSGFTYLVAYYLRSLRWRLLLLEVDDGLSRGVVFSTYMAGLVINYLVPIRLGEFAKSCFLKTQAGLPIARTLPTVFMDKLLDLSPVVVLLLALPCFSWQQSVLFQGLLFTLAALFFLALFILWLAIRKAAQCEALLGKMAFFFPKTYKERYLSFVTRFVSGVALLGHLPRRKGLCLFLYTLCIIAADGLYLWLAFGAVGSHVPYYSVFLGYTLLNLTYILPTPPAQVGSNEVVSLLIFSTLLGMEKNVVALVMTITHIMSGAIILVFGYFSLNLIGVGLWDWQKNLLTDTVKENAAG